MGALTWSEPGDVEADLRAAVERVKQLPARIPRRLAAVDVAASVYRDAQEVVQREVSTPLSYAALLVRCDPTLPASVMIGRDLSGKVVGMFFSGHGWMWVE